MGGLDGYIGFLQYDHDNDDDDVDDNVEEQCDDSECATGADRI